MAAKSRFKGRLASSGKGQKAPKASKAKRREKLRRRREKEALGGFLPKRPEIKGLEEDAPASALARRQKSVESKSSKSSKRPSSFAGKKKAPLLKGKDSQDKETAGGSSTPGKRKLLDGASRLRQVLEKNPELLAPGESTTAAVAACFKKTAQGEAEAASEAKLSGNKRRKLLQLVLSRRKTDERVFVHLAFQLHNRLLRCASAAESEEERRAAVSEALAFLEAPLKRKDRHSCTARLLQAVMKVADAAQRKALFDRLSEDFAEMCVCASFHHVAMKLFLYADAEQQELLKRRLCAKRETAFSKFGAVVWEFVFSSLKTVSAQQSLLNVLMLDAQALVESPAAAGKSPSFAAVFQGLGEEQKKASLDRLSGVVQKFVDKELLDKSHVHRVLKSFADVADDSKRSALWESIAEGALHLATTKDGVETLARLCGFASAKQRKSLVKGLKQHVAAFAQNPVSSAVLLRLLCTVDDSQLLREALLKELFAKTEDLLFHPQGSLVLLQLLQTEGRITNQLPSHFQTLLKLPSPSSKKPLGKLQEELRLPTLASIAAAFAALPEGASGDAALEESRASLENALRDAAAGRVLKALAPASSESEAVRAVLIRVFALLEKQLRKGDEGLLEHAGAQRLLAALVAEAEGEVLDAAWKALAAENAETLLASRGVFVLLQVLKRARALGRAPVVQEIRGVCSAEALRRAKTTLEKAGRPSAGIDFLERELKETL